MTMKTFFAVSVALVAAAIVFNPLFLKRVDLPEHLLNHKAQYFKDFLSQEVRREFALFAEISARVFSFFFLFFTLHHPRQTADELLELVKSFGSLETNANDLKHYKTLHEHIGEAVPFNGKTCPHPLLIPNINRTLCVFPGRVDIGSHFIRTGGFAGLKESYEKLVSRLLSFGVYLFDLKPYPVLEKLFESPGFLAGARAVCPPGKPFIDPFQFNFIVNAPGQSVATHVDGVYFWGATRFQFPQWLLAAMKFSGLWEDRFVDQIQVVAYVHRWQDWDHKEGKFVYYTDNSGEWHTINPVPRSANVVDGSKTVHSATVYMESVEPVRMKPTSKNSLDYKGDDRWQIVSDDQVLSNLTTDDLRISVVYRAKCFKDAAEAERFHNQKDSDMLTLDEVLATFKQDMARKGISTDGLSAFDLGLKILSTYVKYPLPPKPLVPYNYCALPRLFPILKSVLDPLCN